jgi:hypothetical protein
MDIYRKTIADPLMMGERSSPYHPASTGVPSHPWLIQAAFLLHVTKDHLPHTWTTHKEQFRSMALPF